MQEITWYSLIASTIGTLSHIASILFFYVWLDLKQKSVPLANGVMFTVECIVLYVLTNARKDLPGK